ncbi:TELO2-interacting protein 1 homolog [Leptidea sinapis]|uniref:TELO2-interacting protein 1 homolog n=1 Tax=Leptidea sinapis TaxID=189913 RepID=UPI0021379B51|nr:TELO2-interacting protein 1 homolog [Leptidea sinapis]
MSMLPSESPWRQFRNLDDKACVDRMRDICALLGAGDTAHLIVDALLDIFYEKRDSEPLCIMNWMAAAPNSDRAISRRLISTYIEEKVWYLPVELRVDTPATVDETCDVTVYNPRAWTKDNVPGLFEGATEVRYTDISYQTPRVRESNPHACRTPAQARQNMILMCLLTEGVGMMARRLGEEFQPYLMRTLCLVLERVGSRYELLHLAGLKALDDISASGGHGSIAELIAKNADYITNQITRRIKKAWNTKSALEILSVVIDFSDAAILDYLYAIIGDLLSQCCELHAQNYLYTYLQVFDVFVLRLGRWFPQTEIQTEAQSNIDILSDLMQYIKNEEEIERLLKEEEGKTAEEMYTEDVAKKDVATDGDETVTKDAPPLPWHVEAAKSIIQRCVHFIHSEKRDVAVFSMQVVGDALPLLEGHDDELLPLVHQLWSPLVERLMADDHVVKRHAIELLVTMAHHAKDFLRARATKDVLQPLYKILARLSNESRRKDKGSSYRWSPDFSLQMTAMTHLPALVEDLALNDIGVESAMCCAHEYLSKDQPRPLQELAVVFFQRMLVYRRGACWLFLRRLCQNELEAVPPARAPLSLATVICVPHQAPVEFDSNVKAIFGIKS